MIHPNGVQLISVVAGDQCSIHEAERWAQGRQFFNAYGPTETTIVCSIFKYDQERSELSIGKPVENAEFYILSPEQQLLPIGVPGELCIGVGLAVATLIALNSPLKVYCSSL